MGTGVGRLGCTGPLPTHSHLIEVSPRPTPLSRSHSHSYPDDQERRESSSSASLGNELLVAMSTRSCASCTIELTFFKRKINCYDCHDTFCAKCATVLSAPGIVKGKRCFKCRTFAQPNREDLMTLKVPDLKRYLTTKRISTDRCSEKRDLVDLILQFATGRIRSRDSIGTASSSTSSRSQRPMSAADREWRRLISEQVVNGPGVSSRQQFSSRTRYTNYSTQSRSADSSPRIPSAGSQHSSRSYQPGRSPSTPQMPPHNFAGQRQAQSPLSSQSQPLPRQHQSRVSPQSASSTDQRRESYSSNLAQSSSLPMQPRPPAASSRQEATSPLSSQSLPLPRQHQAQIPSQSASPTGRRQESYPSSHAQSSSSPTQPRLAASSPKEQPPVARQPNARTSLDDLVTEDDIGNLSVRQLKEVLARNFIDYKGCIEKSELIQRVQQLFVSHQEEKDEIKRAEASGYAGGSSAAECKICMDQPVDCVLLECGHMVCCTQCGRRLAECPICRSLVSRIVRVFRS